MRSHVLFATAAVVFLGALPAAALKNVSYPEVKVKVSDAYKPDTEFQKMRDALAKAAADKNEAALFALVGPTFVWTEDAKLVDRFDLGRDALHNFKVVFGFRKDGAEKDGGVDDGPFWDSLAAFAADGTYYRASEGGNLVCGPIAAEFVDDQVFERARKRIESGEEQGAGGHRRADRKGRYGGAAGDRRASVGAAGPTRAPANPSAGTAPLGKDRLDSRLRRPPDG